jgi:hypothetical protein
MERALLFAAIASSAFVVGCAFGHIVSETAITFD